MSVRQVCTQIQNGVSSDLYNIPSILGTGVLETPKPLSNIVGSGVYLRPIKWYQVIPLAPDITLIATNQTPVQGGFLTLNLPDDPLLINGLPVISLDCHRVPGFQSVTAQAGTIVFQINGFDDQKVALQSQVTYVPGDTAQVIPSNKGFSFISSIQCISITNGPVTSGFNFGTTNLIAFPEHALLSTNHIISMSWNGVPLATFYGNPANSVLPQFPWRTQEISNTSRDARGYLSPPSTPPDGNTLFTIQYYVYGADSALQTQLLNSFPSAQQMVTGTATLPNLINYDETGMQYPGQFSAWQEIFG